MQAHAGLDVHHRRSQIAVMAEGGRTAVNRNVSNGRESVQAVIGDLPVGTPMAFEAAFGWGRLIEPPQDYGFEPHMAHPLQCKAIVLARLKNDKADAATPAYLPCSDLLHEAWTTPQTVREQRAALRHRARLVRLRTLPRNRIHAALAHHGRHRPSGCRSVPSRDWLDGLPLPAASRQVMADLFDSIDALQMVIDRADVALARTATADPRVKALTKLPGIGLLTEMITVAEVGDVSRFSSARKPASWAGLTPTVRSSDRTVRYGHIYRQGAPWLRRIMNEAARTAKRAPQFAAHYERIAHRRGRKIATSVIARKLLTHAYHLPREAEAAQKPKEPCTAG
ncbi:IS110 family transposase [Streptomyces sp. NPDC059467]|uniref:IS110 family transposase n=1 Tax=Streptomyces sp. NPDC059467 TaxID=3346844 RepID=UPI0036B60FEB